jgi:hypothetical protein
MPKRSPNTQASSVPAIKQRLVVGVAAGNVAVVGIKAHDQLISVIGIKTTGGTPLNTVAEFTITADNLINNAGGTDHTGYDVLVTWWPAPAGL